MCFHSHTEILVAVNIRERDDFYLRLSTVWPLNRSVRESEIERKKEREKEEEGE
jgi:hypothetical protein